MLCCKDIQPVEQENHKTKLYSIKTKTKRSYSEQRVILTKKDVINQERCY